MQQKGRTCTSTRLWATSSTSRRTSSMTRGSKSSPRCPMEIRLSTSGFASCSSAERPRHDRGRRVRPHVRGRHRLHRAGALRHHQPQAPDGPLRPLCPRAVRGLRTSCLHAARVGGDDVIKLSWVKFYMDFFDDARVQVIETMPDADAIYSVH